MRVCLEHRDKCVEWKKKNTRKQQLTERFRTWFGTTLSLWSLHQINRLVIKYQARNSGQGQGETIGCHETVEVFGSSTLFFKITSRSASFFHEEREKKTSLRVNNEKWAQLQSHLELAKGELGIGNEDSSTHTP